MITANHTRLSTKPYFGYNIQDVSQYVMKKLVTEKPVHLRELGRKVLNELPPEKKMGLLKNLISDSKTESLISSPKKLKRVDKLAIEYIKGKLKSFDDSSLKIEEGLFSRLFGINKCYEKEYGISLVKGQSGKKEINYGEDFAKRFLKVCEDIVDNNVPLKRVGKFIFGEMDITALNKAKQEPRPFYNFSRVI